MSGQKDYPHPTQMCSLRLTLVSRRTTLGCSRLKSEFLNGNRSGRSRSASVWLATGCALRENRGVSFTAGMGSADELLPSIFADLQIVGDLFAVRAITKNQSIRWMLKAEVFHKILMAPGHVRKENDQNSKCCRS